MAVVHQAKLSSRAGENFLVFMFSFLGVWACYELRVEATLSASLSSAVVGLSALLLERISFPQKTEIQGCLYAGSFAAMGGLSQLHSYGSILVLGALVASYTVILRPYFKGYGGRLGTLAFLSSLTFVFLTRLF